MYAKMPYLGAGVSYRWHFNAELMRSPGVDWLEVTPEHFLPLNTDTEKRLSILSRRFPIAGHSLELSVGSEGEDAPGYRESIKRMMERTAAAWHGDHLCFTRVGDRAVRALTPVPFTDEAVEISVRNIRSIKAELGLPFVVENVAYHLPYPASRMSEAEMLRRVAVEADAGLLLDLHNLFANAVNHRFDPHRFLDEIPLDRVVQIHVAGGETMEGIRLDTHASLCPDEVWSLLEHVAPRCPLRGVNFEMDGRFPPWARLLEEVDRARRILRKHGAERASS